MADLTRLLNFTVNQRVPGDDKTGEGLSDREKIKAAETIVEGKQELLKQAFARSSVHVSSNGFRASTDALSPYQVEIRTKDSNGEFKVSQPIKIVKDASGNDFAFVDLALGTVFAVRVLNAQGDHDVGVRVLLDGISSFELSEIEQYKQRDCWYVPKNVAGMIKGWFVNEKLTKSFETSTLAEGLITELKRSDLSSVGTITVSFFPAWAGDAEPPVVEKSVTTKAIKSGKDVPNQVKIVDDIQFGKTLLSSITIRYERPTGSNVAESAQAKR